MSSLLFDKGVEKYISKYRNILDIPKNSLCPALFAFTDFNPPAMHASVRMQILRNIEEIAPYIIVRDFYATGKAFIPSENPDPNADIFVNIEFSDNKGDQINNSRALFLAKKLSGHLLDRTQHKVYYRLFSKPVDPHVLQAKYDVLNDKWMKIPSSRL